MKKLKPIASKRSIRLADADARIRGVGRTHKEIEASTTQQAQRISDLQRVFYASAKHALLIVLQGRDASGKDATIRHVFSAVNPQGCNVVSFKVPTDAEQAHDFLWRIHEHVPPRGMIGIFNRSHYEDIIVPQVHGGVPKKVWSARYEQINSFEKMLFANDVVILKFLLHVSREEQRKRLQERIDNPEKNWKFRTRDLDDRQRWNAFTKAYRGVLENTSTRWAPWYIVPADDHRVRNWLVASTIADTLTRLRLRFPPADPAIVGLEVK